MSAFPVFLRMDGRRVLVVGGGPVAAEKAAGLRDAGAYVVLVAPDVSEAAAAAAHEVWPRRFLPEDTDGTWFVVAAAPHDVNAQVREAAEARRLFVIAVDDVAHCSAIGAARFERHGITVALSSDGAAPALVALLRRAIEALLPEDLESWSHVAAEARRGWRAEKVPMSDRRPRLLRALNQLYGESVGAT